MSWRLGDRVLGRVLVTRLRYLGDIVMSTVVTQALRNGDPSLKIGFLCEAAHAPVLADLPELERVHALAAGRRGADVRARGAAAPSLDEVRALGTLALVQELRAARYDAAIDLFFNPRSAWLLRLGVGGARLAGPAGSRRRLYTHRTDAAPLASDEQWRRLAPGGLGEHLARLAPLTHVESGLGFVDWFRAQGRRAQPRLGVRPCAAAATAAMLAAAGVDRGDRPLVLAPAATWAAKRWPVAHWRRLAEVLAASWPGPIVVLTVPGDEADGARIAGGLVVGRGAALPPMPLPAVLDLLAGCSGLVCADGGIMHAAVGMGVPTLALFGPTSPEIWFPYEGTGPYRVLARRPACHPCDRHACDAFVCLPELEPTTVAAAAVALFGDLESKMTTGPENA